MAEFQVKYHVNVIAGIVVKANTAEDAIEKADVLMAKDLFVKGIVMIAGTYYECGYDNLDAWNDAEEIKK